MVSMILSLINIQYLLVTYYHHKPHHHQYQGRERILMILISHKRLTFEALKGLITKVITMMKTIITMIIININIITRAGKRS